MKEELTTAERQTLLPLIQSVLETGTAWFDHTAHYPAGAIISTILEIDGMTKEPTEESREGFETNGWQYDWWQSFKHDGKSYVLSGSGYYGGHTFELAES